MGVLIEREIEETETVEAGLCPLGCVESTLNIRGTSSPDNRMRSVFENLPYRLGNLPRGSSDPSTCETKK